MISCSGVQSLNYMVSSNLIWLCNTHTLSGSFSKWISITHGRITTKLMHRRQIESTKSLTKTIKTPCGLSGETGHQCSSSLRTFFFSMLTADGTLCWALHSAWARGVKNRDMIAQYAACMKGGSTQSLFRTPYFTLYISLSSLRQTLPHMTAVPEKKKKKK